MDHSNLRKLKANAYDAFEDDIDPQIKLALNEEFKKADRLERVVLDEDGFIEFLADHINREATKYAAYDRGEPTDHPHDGTRTEPLCTCPDRHCTLKDARLPNAIRAADDPMSAIRGFKHDHHGDPLVLGDALDVYDEKRAAYKSHVRLIHMCATQELHPDEIPSTDSDSETSEDNSHE